MRILYFMSTVLAWMEVTASKENIDRDDDGSYANAVDTVPIGHSSLNHLVIYGVKSSVLPFLSLPFFSLPLPFHSCPCLSVQPKEKKQKTSESEILFVPGPSSLTAQPK